MKKVLLLTLTLLCMSAVKSQNTLTPELLWKLGRITPLGISKDAKNVVFKVATPSIDENKSNSKYYTIPVTGGKAVEVSDYKSLIMDTNISPDGNYILYNEEVKIDKVHGKDYYPELDKSD